MHGSGHALAEADAALAAHLDLENALVRIPVLHDRDIAMLKVLGLVGAKSGVRHEQHVVVHLLRVPF
ncbi:MAG: hypothetical protein M5R42_21315 [Rhodocyclaceae bacterium]|nr:hypothetical protein [Rhodocyclaceae bacterium]